MANLSNEQVDEVVADFCKKPFDRIYDSELHSVAIKEYVFRTSKNFALIEELNSKLKRDLNANRDKNIQELGKSLSMELCRVRKEIKRCEYERRHAMKDIVSLGNKINRMEEFIINKFSLDKKTLKRLIKSRARHE